MHYGIFKKRKSKIESIFDEKLLYEVEPFLLKYRNMVRKGEIIRIRRPLTRPVEIHSFMVKRYLTGPYRALDMLLEKRFGWKVLSEGMTVGKKGNYYFIPLGDFDDISGVCIGFSQEDVEKARPFKPSRSSWEEWEGKPWRLKLLYKSPSKYLKLVRKEKSDDDYLYLWLDNLQKLVYKCKLFSSLTDEPVMFRCAGYILISTDFVSETELRDFFRGYLEKLFSEEEQTYRRIKRLFDNEDKIVWVK